MYPSVRSLSFPASFPWQCMGDLKRDGVEVNCKQPGVHDPLEPEYSILKQRIARRLAYEKINPLDCSLVDMTKAAERVITSVSGAGRHACARACECVCACLYGAW